MSTVPELRVASASFFMSVSSPERNFSMVSKTFLVFWSGDFPVCLWRVGGFWGVDGRVVVVGALFRQAVVRDLDRLCSWNAVERISIRFAFFMRFLDLWLYAWLSATNR